MENERVTVLKYMEDVDSADRQLVKRVNVLSMEDGGLLGAGIDVFLNSLKDISNFFNDVHVLVHPRLHLVDHPVGAPPQLFQEDKVCQASPWHGRGKPREASARGVVYVLHFVQDLAFVQGFRDLGRARVGVGVPVLV